MPIKALLLLGCLTIAGEVSASPPTRLYVRTVPPGAKVTLEGKSLGKSDALFSVAPGTQTVSVELDGYLPEERRVEIRAEEITRVELQLKRRPEAEIQTGTPATPSAAKGDAEKKDDGASIAANAYLIDADLPAPVRGAMLTVLRQHPTENHWSGRASATMFGIAAKRLPAGTIRQRAVPAILELTQMLAFQELLKAKSLLDRYAASGLTDATTLRQALVEAAGSLRVAGKAGGAAHQASVQGSFAVAYVFADEATLSAHLLQPAELAVVQAAYREVMHRQARDLMKRANWKDALLLWHHLHVRKLVSQQLYLDAAQCFKELGQDADVVRVLNEAVNVLGPKATPEFLEQAGDLALAIKTDAAEELAERAYREASDKLKESISQPEVGAERSNPVQ